MILVSNWLLDTWQYAILYNKALIHVNIRYRIWNYKSLLQLMLACFWPLGYLRWPILPDSNLSRHTEGVTFCHRWSPFNLTVRKCMYSVYNVHFVHESQWHIFLVSYLARLFFDIFPEYNRSVDFLLYCKYKAYSIFVFNIGPYGLCIQV